MYCEQKSGGFLFEWLRAVRGAQLSLRARAVVLTLATYADMDGGSCFPSYERLAKDCCCSVSTIKRALKEAKKAGVISAQQRLFGGKKTSNLYQLTLPGSGKPADGGKREAPGVTGDPRPGVTCDPPPRDAGDPLPAQQEKTTQRDHLSNAGAGARGRGKPARRRSEATGEQRRFLLLWSSVMVGIEAPGAWGLGGASYAQLTTALAWTIYNKQQSVRRNKPIHNTAGYFVNLLKTVVYGGEKTVREWSEEHLLGLIGTGMEPDKYVASGSRA